MILNLCGLVMVIVGMLAVGIMLGADVTLSSSETPKQRRAVYVAYAGFALLAVLGAVFVLGV